VPTPLPVTAAEKSAGKSFSYLGYGFEWRWTAVKRGGNYSVSTLLFRSARYY
jgi:hypothetical protein